MALAAAQYLKGVIDILQEYEETESSTQCTLTQILLTAGGDLLRVFVG